MGISPWDGKEWDMTERLALLLFSLRGKDCGSIQRILQIIKTPPPSLRKHLQAWRSSQDGKMEVRKGLPEEYLARASMWLVAQLCLTLYNPMDCSPPGCSLYGIAQARILEKVAISSSRGSSQPRD